MPNTRSGASKTYEEIEDLIAHRVAEEIEAHKAAMNLEPLIENRDEQGNGNGGNGGNRNGGNGLNGNGGNRGNRNGGNGGNGENGNGGNGGNGNGNGGNGENGNGGNGGNGNGDNGENGNGRNGGNRENGNGNRNMNHGMNYGGFMPMARECTFQYFLKCKPQNFSGTKGVDSALTWWNTYKRTIGVDVAYAMNWAGLMRFQELILLCTRMLPDEEDTVKRFIGGLPDNIQGNVIIAEPTKLQDAIRIANNLIDQKLKGYARSAKNKRRCGNCKKVGHLTRDCRAAIAPNTQRAAVGNQAGVICYECRRSGHFRKDYPKLRNQFRGNQTKNKNENKAKNQTGGNEATAEPMPLEEVEQTLILTLSRVRLLDHPFDIDLMPIELGSFDVIISMDWLAKYDALIVCDKKVVRIPYRDEVLIIRGDNYDGGTKLNIISCMRTHKYIEKGCQVYIAQVTSKKAEDKSEDKRLENVPIV
ncbi:putative reverse transcriptase domain-containing protein [Tanacetum coccineum]